MHNNESYPGSVAMARIDGEAIRRLRETKGLTQLYVATAVGVTTDTISRWENRRYPTVKQENAAKLAEALEVPLSAILEEQPEEDLPAAAPPPPTAAGFSRQRRPVLLLTTIALLLLAATAAWLIYPAPERSSFEVIRILPAHVPPGQTFPVILRLTGDSNHPSPLIIREELPDACAPLQGEPAFTSIDREGRIIKWISRVGNEPVFIAYLARASSEATMGKTLEFRGTIILHQEVDATIEIAGSHSLELLPYHWVDGNRDGRVDDEEILSVYDAFSLLEDHPLDRELIERIWAADGYRWNQATGLYEIL